MSGDISSVGGLSVLATAMKDVSIKQAVEVSVIKKAQDVQEQQGEAALKLIASAGSVSSQHVDIKV